MQPTSSRLERETTICFNEEEPIAYLWTASPKEFRRWTKLGLAPTVYGGGWRCEAPKGWIKVRKPRTKQLTEDQRQALSNRMRVVGQRNRVVEEGNSP